LFIILTPIKGLNISLKLILNQFLSSAILIEIESTLKLESFPNFFYSLKV